MVLLHEIAGLARRHNDTAIKCSRRRERGCPETEVGGELSRQRTEDEALELAEWGIEQTATAGMKKKGGSMLNCATRRRESEVHDAHDRWADKERAEAEAEQC